MIQKPKNLEIVGDEHPFKQFARKFIADNFGKISQRAIARFLGIGKTTENRWAAELGYKFKKHTVDDHYFDRWSSEMAYIFGFICADGNIAWNTEKGYY